MRPEDRDAAYLWDLREAAREVADLVTPLTREEFTEQRLLRFAVERLLIILGEAGACVSEKYRLSHPEIPWSSLQRIRNGLAHGYGRATAQRVWTTARNLIVPLSIQLTSLIKAPPTDEPDRSL